MAGLGTWRAVKGPPWCNSGLLAQCRMVGRALWSESVALGGRTSRTQITNSGWAKGQHLWLKPCVFGVDLVWSGLHGTLNIVGDPHVVCGKLLLVFSNVHSFFKIHRIRCL